MKNKLYKFLSKPYIVIVVMIIAPILSIADRNFGYFFGLFIASISVMEKWLELGKIWIWEKDKFKHYIKRLITCNSHIRCR